MSQKAISISHMPEEIVMDILSRLPVKSLLQFRSVSKQWRSIIDDRQLISSHLTRSLLSSSNHRLLLPTFPLQSVNYNASSNIENASMELDCPFVSQNTLIEIVGSCNGLVCFLVDSGDFIIYNSSTRHSKTLLAPQQLGSSLLGIHGFVYGFGCSPSPLDFKLVILSRFTRNSQISSDFVFGKNDSSWRTLDSIHTFNFGGLYPSVFLNGYLHWLAHLNDGEAFIASFDISEESFKEICPPPHNNLPLCNLGELNGQLYVVYDDSEYIDIWVMKEYGVEKSWMKFFRSPEYITFDMVMLPLSFTKEGEVLIEINFRDIVAYDTTKKTLRNVTVLGGPRLVEGVGAVVYVETLVAPDGVE